MTTEPNEPSENDIAGMAWWNAMEDHERKAWFDRIGTGIPRDVWELFKSENPDVR
ncbi:hypothetical protein [Tardiphaga sp.]|uniref:hypothetical protein n=1 Tax=Tardiphaga sp. TaxID=1926292 RepID=UPI0025DC6CEE|nr:hypothetical protein [Tardiphaga sp.]